MSDAQQRLGQPNQSYRAADGGTTITYTFIHSAASGTSFIPVVGGIVGHNDTQTQTVTINFDKSGKFVNYTSSTGQTSAGMINHS